MDPYTIFSQITAFVDPLVVFLVLVFTEIIKRLIPCEGMIGTTCVPSWVNRVLPFVPLVLGVILICIKGNCLPNADIAIKGVVSGAVASYIFRTYKVTILGD